MLDLHADWETVVQERVVDEGGTMGVAGVDGCLEACVGRREGADLGKGCVLGEIYLEVDVTEKVEA